MPLQRPAACAQVVILHETASEGAAEGREEAEGRLGFSSLAERKRGEVKTRVLLGRWLGETGQGFGTDVTGGTLLHASPVNVQVSLNLSIMIMIINAVLMLSYF